MKREVYEILEKERRYLYWLCRNPHLGAVAVRKLLRCFGSGENLWQEILYNIEEIETQDERGELAMRLQMEGRLLKPAQWRSLREWMFSRQRCEEEYERLAEHGVRFVTPLDVEYPKRLKEIYDYPMGLFVKGSLPAADRPAAAVVGARGCSAYGEQVAEEFSRMLASEGVQIISGLALGIDGAAHRGALKAGGETFAVLGCGVNICYPPANYGLYEAMKGNSGVLSEFPLDTHPAPRNFPMRNRLISGLADVVLVVEAKERSGSLITAELGLEQGREIFAIPGRVTDHLSRGCNELIRQGAHVAISPNDILEYLGVKCQKELILHEKNVNGLAKKEKMVYSCLDFKPKHLDEILATSGLSVGECMGILMELELGGYVFRAANHYYGKKL